ncbi:MAG: hypothetical protein KAS13_04430 [Candidatus Omnitrophica bacterium]|nr:hypothetical protein [Candidatus Omnitrophota bacterium]
MLKKVLLCSVMFISITCFFGSSAYAQWKVQYDAAANKTMRLGGDTLRGNFASEQACQNYQASRPAYDRAHSKCVYVGGGNSGSSVPTGGTGNMAQDVAGQLFGNMLQSIFNPPAQAPVDNSAQLKAMELQKQQNQKKWQDLQAKKKAEQQAQEAAKKRRGKELLSQMSKFGAENSLGSDGVENSLGSDLFGSKEVKCEGGVCVLELESFSAGKYDTSSLSALNRLRAANYFSQKSLEAMNNGDGEGARHFSLQAQRVMAGEMVDEKYELSALPNVPEPPAPTRVEEQSPEFANYNAYLKNDIKIKLERVDKTQKQIKKQKKKAEQDIVKLNDESKKAKSLEEKQKYDELVLKAKLILERTKNSIKEVDEIKKQFEKQQEKLNK